MQQLPMAFLNIALGGKSPVLGQMGKSLSNDDFGQILGSIQGGEDWLQQQLLDRLGPEQLAELQRQLSEGMSLPEAAKIYLQQQRQAAGLPPLPLEGTSGDAPVAADAGDLPWPLSRHLFSPPPTGPETPTAQSAGRESPAIERPIPPAIVETEAPATAPIPGVIPGIPPSVPTDSALPSTTAGLDPSPDPVPGGMPAPPATAPPALVEPTSATAIEHLPAPATPAAPEASATPAARPTGSSPPISQTPAGPWPVSPVGATEAPFATPATAAAVPPDAGAPAGIAAAPPLPPVAKAIGSGFAGPRTLPVEPVPLDANRPGGAESVQDGEMLLPAQTPLASTLRTLLREPPSTRPGLPDREPWPAAAAGTPSAEPVRQTGPLALAAGESALPRIPATAAGPIAAREAQPVIPPDPVVQAPNPPATEFRLTEGPGNTLPPQGLSANQVATTPVSEVPVLHSLSAFSAADGTAVAAARPAAAPMAELVVPQRFNEADWSQALGERLVLMAGREQQGARIKLNPPHLGPLEVKLSLQQDQASVSFLTQHAPVREALEQAIPRLREMFSQQDLQLVNVDVGQRREAPTGGGQGSAQGQGRGMADTAPGRESGPAIELSIASRAIDTDRRLDLYV